MSLDRFGYVSEIVVDKKTNLIADGDHRLKDLIKKGFTEVDVKVFDFKNDEERRLFRQVTKKVQGTHSNLELEAEELKVLLKSHDMEELSETLAQSEQEILNLLNKQIEEDKPDDVEDVDKLGKLQITCPFCNKSFQKKDE